MFCYLYATLIEFTGVDLKYHVGSNLSENLLLTIQGGEYTYVVNNIVVRNR